MHDLENSNQKGPPSPVAGPETELPTPIKDSGLPQRPRSTSFYAQEMGRFRQKKRNLQPKKEISFHFLLSTTSSIQSSSTKPSKHSATINKGRLFVDLHTMDTTDIFMNTRRIQNATDHSMDYTCTELSTQPTAPQKALFLLASPIIFSEPPFNNQRTPPTKSHTVAGPRAFPVHSTVMTM